MGAKKEKKGGAKGASKLDDADLQGIETLLESGDLRAALDRLNDAVVVSPTTQVAWYHRGVAAAELWEDLLTSESSMSACSRSEADSRGSLFSVAVTSFRRVRELDTSRRGETLFLATLALGEVLVRAACSDEDSDDGSNPNSDELPGKKDLLSALTEANAAFEDATRMVTEWGHPPLTDEAVGHWGQGLARQMKLSATEDVLQSASMDVGVAVTGVLSLLDRASEKFTSAVTTAEPTPDGNGDMHWMTLHTQHLLAFVDFVRCLFAGCKVNTSSSDIGRRAATAWRDAAGLAHGVLELSGSSWEALMLSGDVFAAGAQLLSAGKAPGARLIVCEEFDDQPEDSVDLESAVARAEAAYTQAAARNAEMAAATAGLALGDLLLDLGRPGSEIHLRKAAECFQRVAGLKTADGEEIATAWYNLACISGLLGKPEHAAEALQRGLRRVKSQRQRAEWVREAMADSDLETIRGHPSVVKVLNEK